MKNEDSRVYSASIDNETDEGVQRGLHHEFRDRTLICISRKPHFHPLASNPLDCNLDRIRNVLAYDRIVVLDGGVVVVSVVLEIAPVPLLKPVAGARYPVEIVRQEWFVQRTLCGGSHYEEGCRWRQVGVLARKCPISPIQGNSCEDVQTAWRGRGTYGESRKSMLKGSTTRDYARFVEMNKLFFREPPSVGFNPPGHASTAP